MVHLKEKLMLPDFVERKKTNETLGWYYKVGSFQIRLELPDNKLYKKMSDIRYFTVTTADQIFMTYATEKDGEWHSPEIEGVLYDLYFPKTITIEFHDKRHMSKNNSVEEGFAGTMQLNDTFLQAKMKIGDRKSASFEMELLNVEKNSKKIPIKIHLEFKYDNEPVAKDQDATEYFREAMDRAERWMTGTEKVDVAEAFLNRHHGIRGLHIILVPGLFTGAYPGYFDENVKALKKLDISHSICPIKSEDPIESNAEILIKDVETIMEENPKVSIIMAAHSKGGCDALEALTMDRSNGLADKIFGIINMQCPIGGTPMVEALLAGGSVGGLAKGTGAVVDKLFNTQTRNAVKDLGLENRHAYMKALYKAGPKDDFSLPKALGVHFLSFCSYADFGESHNLNDTCGRASMGITNKKIEDFGHRSDGLVCIQAGRIPGGDSIFVEDAYHTTPALQLKGNAYHSGYLTIALLDTMLHYHPLHISKSMDMSAISKLLKDNNTNYNRTVAGGITKSEYQAMSDSEETKENSDTVQSPVSKRNKVASRVKSILR